MKRIINLKECISYNVENGQSDAYIISSDLEKVAALIAKGWKFVKQKEGYYLRAPSVWLVDMTDPNKINYYGNLYVNFAYYSFIKDFGCVERVNEWITKVIKLNRLFYDDFQYSWTQGPIVESEFRLIGSDSRVNRLKEDLFSDFYQNIVFIKYMKKAEEYLGRVSPLIIEERPLQSQTTDIQSYYRHISNIFSCYNVATYNSKIIHFDLKMLPEYRKIILSPTGCFDFLSSIIESTNIDTDRIGFYEIHSDPNKIGSGYYNCEIEDDDVVILFDKVYSGYSLDELAKKIVTMGGKPIKVGLFPKSRAGITKSDYIIIGGKIFDAKEVVKTREWVSEYYKKAFSSV